MVTVVMEVSQDIGKPDGIRMRSSFFFVIVGVTASSVIVMVTAAVGASPTAKLWLDAEETVCASA